MLCVEPMNAGNPNQVRANLRVYCVVFACVILPALISMWPWWHFYDAIKTPHFLIDEYITAVCLLRCFWTTIPNQYHVVCASNKDRHCFNNIFRNWLEFCKLVCLLLYLQTSGIGPGRLRTNLLVAMNLKRYSSSSKHKATVCPHSSRKQSYLTLFQTSIRNAHTY